MSSELREPSDAEASLGCDPAAEALVGAFCEALRVERNASPHTVRAYRVDLTDYARWALRSGVDPLSATHRQVRRYLASLTARSTRARPSTAACRALRSFLPLAQRDGRGRGGSGEHPSRAPSSARAFRTVIRPADMARLLSVYSGRDAAGAPREQSASDMRNQALLEFLYACGARRVGGVGAARRRRRFRARPGQGVREGRQGAHRAHPRDGGVVHAHLRVPGRPQLLRERSCAHFFVSTRGNQMGTDAMRKMFKEAVRRAGLDESLSPHDMRHTLRHRLAQRRGRPCATVQEMLGHASLSTTQVYTHLTPGRLKDVHERAHPRG